MIQRVMNLLWTIMMAPDAPLEVSKSPAITDALQSYAYGKGKVDNKLIHHYMQQCVHHIQQGKNVLPAMSLLQRLLYASVSSCSPTTSRTQCDNYFACMLDASGLCSWQKETRV